MNLLGSRLASILPLMPTGIMPLLPSQRTLVSNLKLDTNALFPILKSLIWSFIIKTCRNLNEKVRLRQISCLKVVVISCFL